MASKRIKLEVIVDLDPVPGAFHTKEDAANWIQEMLLRTLPHYNPVVFAPKEPEMSELEANSIKLGEAHADKMIESDAALKELREKLTGHAKEKGVVGAGLSGSEHFCQYRDWLAVATDKIDSLLAERGEIHHEINLLTERVQELSAELDYERAFASYLRARGRVKKLEKKLPSGRIGSL